MRLRRPLRALQVEPTSRCTRSCAVCPRTPLSARWRDGDLDRSTWQQLRPQLDLARHVHLQGWGEPLLHPELRTMVRDAKAAHCRVGMTTNGDLLDALVPWIIEGDIDLLAISVAGTASTHARLRDGSELDRVWAVLSILAEQRHRRRPRLQVSYLLTADNAGDLPEVVEDAAAAGADEVFVIHLDALPTAGLAKRTAFSGDVLRSGVAAALDRAEDAAAVAGIGFRGPARTTEELLACALDPTRFAFVTWDGLVAPCVNLGVPVAGPIPRFVDGRRHEVRHVIWGDLHEQSLSDILAGDRARRFRAPFAARTEAERRFLLRQRGWGTTALRRLERSARDRQAHFDANPFPPECRGCPKQRGW